MTVDQQNLERVDAAKRPDAQTAAARLSGQHPLQQASLRLQDFREGRSTLKARDLVGLLLSHGARAWRSSQPVSLTRICVRTPGGDRAVRLRFR